MHGYRFALQQAGGLPTFRNYSFLLTGVRSPRAG
jgi:hypothetical protein